MTARTWLRHPATTARRPAVCATDDHPYRTRNLAHTSAVTRALAGSPGWQPEQCACGNWRLVRAGEAA